MLNKLEIKSLLKSGDWMIRFDNDGVAFGGFRWKGIDEWTEASDWNTTPTCGHGLHGQNPKAAGHCTYGSRMVLCETKGEQIIIENNNVIVKYAKIIAVNEEIPLEFITGLASVGGSLYLRGYDHPLPAGLQKEYNSPQDKRH